MTPSAPKQTSFDVIIVGGGPAGLFSAYYLSAHSDLSVLLIEKGKPSLKRTCPISGSEQESASNADHAIFCQASEALAFFRRQTQFHPQTGQDRSDAIHAGFKAMALIEETEQIFNAYGMDGQVFPTDMDAAEAIRRRSRKFGVDLLLIKQKHLGSDRLPHHMAKMVSAMRENINIHTSETAKDLVVTNGEIRGVVTNRTTYSAKNVILAPGRVGAEWMGSIAKNIRCPCTSGASKSVSG